jgi:hypothetical protein
MKPIAEMTTDEAGAALVKLLDAMPKRDAHDEGAAIISAQLVDVRNIGQHKCVKLTVHVPVEQARSVLDAFGWPDMANPVPVAIARLDPSKASGEVSRSPEEEPDGKGEEPSRRTRSDAEKKRWDELPAATQIVLACKDEQFRSYLGADDEIMAQAIVLSIIGAQRKRDVLPGTQLLTRWSGLYGSFTAERDYGGRAA